MKRAHLPVLLTLMTWAASGRAQTAAAIPPQNAPIGGTTSEGPPSRHWQPGPTRLFVSGALELGYGYVRPQLAVGWGRPHWAWAGWEAQTGVSSGGFAQYVGLRGVLPWASLRAGARYQAAFSRSVLPVQETYTRTDLDTPLGDPWEYVALEGEATGNVNLPVGALFGVATVYRVTLVPARDLYVFEESLKVVIEPPWVWRGRLGYSLAFGRDDAARAGVVCELIGVPGRDALVVRAGLVSSVLITRHLEVLATLVPVWASPDRIGLLGADFGQLGIRFRWATDEPTDERAPPRTPGEP